MPRNQALLQHVPARLDASQTAYLLGFQEHDIRILVSEGLLKPLGNPVQNAIKYFERNDVLAKSDDRRWLDDATEAVGDHWAKQNAQKKSARSIPELAAMAA